MNMNMIICFKLVRLANPCHHDRHAFYFESSGLFEMEGSCLDAVIDRCITRHVFRVKVLVSSSLFKMAFTVTCDVGTLQERYTI